MKRTAIFFVLFFSAFLVPMGIAVFLAVTGPDPYVIEGRGPGAEWLDWQEFDDGSRVLVRAFADADEASGEARRIFNAVPTAFVQRTFDVARYRRSDNDWHGLIMPVGRYVIEIQAPQADVVEARFAALDFVAENPEPNYVWIALTDRLGLSLAVLAGYILFLGLFLARGGAWAARLEPRGSSAPASPSSLRERLLEINSLGQPFQVSEVRPGRLMVEWRIADPAWIGVMATSGLRRAHRFYLDLDDSTHTVRVLEKTYKISWGGGIRNFSGRVSFFQGISFAGSEQGRAVGLNYEPGKGFSVREGYNYRFNIAEVRTPLIEIVLGSGWTWQPVMTFFRPIGG